MSTPVLRLAGLLAVVSLMALAPISARADMPSEVESRIEDQLSAATDLELTEMPLSDFVEMLADKHGIEVKLDRRALEGASVAADTLLSFSAKGVRLSAALDLALAELGLDWEVRSDMLRITTPEAAAARTDTRIYDVRELVGDESSDELADLVRTGVFLHATPGEEEGEGTAALPRMQGKVTVYKNLLVVTAPYKSHRRTKSFLAELKQELAK